MLFAFRIFLPLLYPLNLKKMTLVKVQLAESKVCKINAATFNDMRPKTS